MAWHGVASHVWNWCRCHHCHSWSFPLSLDTNANPYENSSVWIVSHFGSQFCSLYDLRVHVDIFRFKFEIFWLTCSTQFVLYWFHLKKARTVLRFVNVPFITSKLHDDSKQRWQDKNKGNAWNGDEDGVTVVSFRERLIAFLIFAPLKIRAALFIIYTTPLCLSLSHTHTNTNIIWLKCCAVAVVSLYFLVIIIFCCFHTLFIILHVLVEAHIYGHTWCTCVFWYTILYIIGHWWVCITRLRICCDSRQQRGVLALRYTMPNS